MCFLVDLILNTSVTLDRSEGKIFNDNIITTLSVDDLTLRIYWPPVVMPLLCILAYLCFLLAVKIYTKDERIKVDWSMWLARLVSSALMGLVVVLIIINDKHVKVFDWPPANYFALEAIFMIIPINWMILSGSIRLVYSWYL